MNFSAETRLLAQRASHMLSFTTIMGLRSLDLYGIYLYVLRDCSTGRKI